MRKKYLFIPQAHKWNETIHKFLKLHNRITILKKDNVVSENILSKLIRKLETMYHRLEKMQYSVGVKLAGATLSLMFLSATVTAQNFLPKNSLQQLRDIQINYASAPTFADIDGDGDLDLFVGEYDGYITEFTNENEIFIKKGHLQTINGNDIKVNHLSAPVFTDIDGDGDLDLFVGEYSGYLIEFKNIGNETFATGDTVRTERDIIKLDCNSPAFADLDKDGDLDLFIGEYYGYIIEFKNNDFGKFSIGDTLKADGNNIRVNYRAKPAFADLDNDGNLDLLVGEYYGAITKFKNNGSGDFAAGVKVQAGENDISGRWSAPAFADLDYDGDLDLYVGEMYGTLSVYENNAGCFIANEKFQAVTDLKTQNYSHPVFADIDGDGDLDLYSGDYNGNIIFFKNTGNKYFATGDTVKAKGYNINLGYLSTPTFADIDNDGDLDLISGESNGLILVYKNIGSGYLFTGDTLQANGNIITIQNAAPAFADLDNNNKTDLYVGTKDGYILTFKNNGSGYDAGDTLCLANNDTLKTNGFANPMFFDINNDRYQDLIVGDKLGFIVAYKNNGSGGFLVGDTLQANGTNIKITEGFAAVAFADMNNDGKIELYVGNKAGTIKLYEDMPGAGFSTLDNSAEIKLYPNPTSNTVTINADDSYNVTIMDLSGKEVFNGKMNSNTMTIDMSQYNAGIYLVKLSNENVVKTTKLVVE